MRLTAESVRAVILDCVFEADDPRLPDLRRAVDEGKDVSDVVAEGPGVTNTFMFVRAKVEARQDEIATLLAQLPENFMHDSAGKGWSFLAACVRSDGTQWGEHPDVEMLFALGIAAGFVRLLFPRALWRTLPGGLPYYVVTLPNTVVAP